MQKVEQQQLFDYASLDNETRVFVQEKAQSIHARLKRTAEDVIAIGLDLIDVKSQLEHGQFQHWVYSEFSMTYRTALNFMRVAERFAGKSEIISLLSVTVLYELAAPSTPDVVIKMVESGDIDPTLPAIREAKRETQIVDEHNAALNGYRGYERWQEAHKWEEKRKEMQALVEQEPVSAANNEPETEYTPIDDINPSFTQWQQDNLALGLDRFGDVLPNEDKEEPEEKIILVEPPEEKEQRKEQRDAHVMRVMGSSESPEWYTPQMVIERVLDMFGSIDTDPCSNSHENPNIPAHTLYTKDDDGLAHTWYGKTYLNPPYGTEIGKWTNKLIADYKQGNVEEALALLPARIDTAWFYPLYEFLMCNVRGRIQFANSPYSAPFPCVIVYLGRREDVFIATFKSLGPIMRRIG